LLAVLSLHGLLSILKQFTRFQPFLNRLDPVGLLPYWAFFAPKPGTSDHRVLVRKKDAEGNVGSWSEICVHEPRLVSHLLWNPSKIRQKCVSDCVRDLLREVSKPKENDSDFIQLSWPYIKLAQLAFSDHSLEKDELRQFSVVASTGIQKRDLHPLFISRWHR
jgi:hypothetical protein